ncbi:Disease resistance protein L6 [Linum perenne]
MAHLLGSEASSFTSCSSTPFGLMPPLPNAEYEVFLSFRGPDVRTTFADCLYSGLVRSKIRTFRDEEELRKGETIGPSLVQAITESKIYIPIFTKGYAASKWCLMELAKMVACWKQGKGHMVLPIFYYVDPRDVRHQDGPYKESFEQHSQNHDPEIVKKWREALQEIGKMKGWHLTESQGQGEVIDEILSKVELHLRSNYTLVNEELVGIDSHVQDVTKLMNLDSDGERVVGIHGMGGIGKTTIAKAVYDVVCTSFDKCCFLDNVRNVLSKDDGATTLQNKVISTILGYDNLIKNVGEGIRIIRDRVCKYKVLIVLDDVDEKFEFDQVLGRLGNFSLESRFIITTRDKRVDEKNKFWMHDHIRDLGRAIVVGEDVENPCNRSIIWSNVDAVDLLKNGKGTDVVEMMRVDLGYEHKLTNKELNKLKGLRYLDVKCGSLSGDFCDVLANLRWIRLRSHCQIPTNLNIKNCVILDLVDSQVKSEWRGWKGIKYAGKLKVLKLRECGYIDKFPDVSSCVGLEVIHVTYSLRMTGVLDISSFTNLKSLVLDNTGITELRGDIGLLHNLQEIVIKDCELRETPAAIFKLSSLQILNLTSHRKKPLIVTEDIPTAVKHLSISCLSVPNLLNLHQLEELHYLCCRETEIPADLWKLPKLKTLTLCDVQNMENLDGIENLVQLTVLVVELCGVVGKFPDVSNLTKLKSLSIICCQRLTEIQDLSGLKDSLTFLEIKASDCLTKVEGIETLESLQVLSLERTGGSASLLPSSLSKFCKLQELTYKESWYVPDEMSPQQLPDLPVDIKVLKIKCESIKKLPDLSKLAHLEKLNVQGCTYLTEIRGLERLVSLQKLVVSDCYFIKELNLCGAKNLRKLKAFECVRLKRVHGIEELELLQVLEVDTTLRNTVLKLKSAASRLRKRLTRSLGL